MGQEYRKFSIWDSVSFGGSMTKLHIPQLHKNSLVEICINLHHIANVFYWCFTAYLLIGALGIYPAGTLLNSYFDQDKGISS